MIFYSLEISIFILSLYISIKFILLFRIKTLRTYNVLYEKYRILRYLPFYMLITFLPSFIGRICNLAFDIDLFPLFVIGTALDQSLGYINFIVLILSSPINIFLKNIYSKILICLKNML